MRWLLLTFSLLTCAVSLLNWGRAPDYRWAWKLAIVAGEFGHWLVLLPLGVAVIAFFTLDGGPRLACVLLCGIAVAGLLRPVVTAKRIAGVLPKELSAAFGATREPSLPPFGFGRLFWRAGFARITPRTEIVAQPDGQELRLDFYAPSTADHARRAPCIVMIHGGGWDSGDRKQLDDWNFILAARGYAVAAISYRLAPRAIWPAQREDILASIAWLKAHADQLGIDATRLVLMGRSAGGQLATAVGYGAHDPAIRGVIALYAPHDMPFAWSVSREDDALNSVNLMKQYFGGPPNTPERLARYEAASGQLLARADSPPTLLIHGVPDTLSWFRHSERLAARLQELGVRHYYLCLPWATHGFDFNPDGPGGQLADEAIGEFLAATLR